jgi:hypothetical protein
MIVVITTLHPHDKNRTLYPLRMWDMAPLGGSVPGTLVT